MKLFEWASHVSSAWSLAAFAIAGVVALALRQRKDSPPIAWQVMAVIALLALMPILAQTYDRAHPADALYRVRVTVLDRSGAPVEDADLTSSWGGEPKQVKGGWEFNISPSAKPDTGQLTVYAVRKNSFERGKVAFALGNDRSPAVTLSLARDTTASVAGRVEDEEGHALAGARVSVTGHDAETDTTTASGGFRLAAHAAEGQQVSLHAEKTRYSADNRLVFAGSTDIVLTLRQRGGGRPR